MIAGLQTAVCELLHTPQQPEEMRPPSSPELMENGTMVVGGPRTVRDHLARLREASNAGKLVTMLQFGVLSDELTRRNMEVFAAEAMPHLRG